MGEDHGTESYILGNNYFRQRSEIYLTDLTYVAHFGLCEGYKIVNAPFTGGSPLDSSPGSWRHTISVLGDLAATCNIYDVVCMFFAQFNEIIKDCVNTF
jgi:hypothetical protein